MAEKIYRADINLKNNEIKNFAVHNIDPETVVNPVDGQEVYFEGKLFVYDANIPAWVEQGTASSIAQVASDLASEITRATGAETTLQNNIDAEATARENADSALQDNIDAEETRAKAAEQVLTDNLSAETSARIAADNTKVDKEINGTNGKALIFNESDGGGAKFEHTDGTWSFVGVNDGGEDGIAGQIYAVKPVSGGTANGARIDVSQSGMYYTVGNQSASQRMVADNEIATKGDVSAEEARALAAEAELASQIAEKDSLPERNAGTVGKFLTNDGTDASWAALPEYTITKDAQAETGYAHTYHLTKDGVNVGASINIPKDMVVESGTVETCTQDDVPVVGYKVGDKYIDLVLANSGQSHLYILVSDLIDVYQGSTYIDITNNTISLKYSDLETKLQDTFYTESEINDIVDDLETSIATKVAQSDYDTKIAELEDADDALDLAKADKATTLAGYNISDAYTKTEIDNMLSAKKQVVSCPALTASGSQFTWSFNNTVGEDAIVTIYESGVEVIADVSVTASTITVKFNETSELPSITAGQFKAVVLG